MLQITLEPQVQVNSDQSQRNNDWDFKLKVVREGNYTELRVSFETLQNPEPEKDYIADAGNYE
ncbi:MAG: hypothetical protein FD143_2614 [Ignavibacteria bacterium]|nr:MAG: hypothetical protein FD143_2614 [Ignavibacteria bacterium]KAF0156895.1 MAG: hypothetical protein FD188_2856 [Ignavibacteria bacterium]